MAKWSKPIRWSTIVEAHKVTGDRSVENSKSEGFKLRAKLDRQIKAGLTRKSTETPGAYYEYKISE
jgi:hypothetical protein